ncbi:MAG: RusA family crossover junction endodeoxyribonuclease [Nitrospirales bacterium]|nr:RusA family crossover junction endodeoxyribonuclease [Nitrospira sp.]MDR4459978.1 RusA family crossover junction endodeoxyribonuclease [Nitrospirales bacterium]
MRTIRIHSLPNLLPSKARGGLVLLSGNKKRKAKTVSSLQWEHLGGDALSPRELFVVLPLPPSINHQYATVNGRRVLASTGRQYKTAVASHLLTVLRQSSHRTEFLSKLETHALSLSLRFHFKTALRRDLDGGLKIAQDAICQAIDLNDNRINEIHLHKNLDSVRPRLECILAIQEPITHPLRSSRSLSRITKISHRNSPPI